MPMRRRLALVAVIAVAVVGGFLPHGVLSAGQSTATDLVQVAQTPFTSAPSCADAVCGKGSPAPPAPVPIVALAAMVGGLVVAAIAAARLRRQRAHLGPLPAGTPDAPFHPPQFS